MGRPKASTIHRVFSEQDELVLVRSMIDYKSKKGHDAIDKYSDFTNFVYPYLSFSATTKQVADKIRRLKIRFNNNSQRGPNPSFLRDHQGKLFRLSKKVWSSSAAADEEDDGDGDDDSDSDSDSDVKSGDNDVCMQGIGNKNGGLKNGKKKDWWVVYPYLCASLKLEAKKASTFQMCSKEYVKMVMTRIDEEKASELEKEWKSLFHEEHELYVKKTRLIRKQSEAMENF